MISELAKAWGVDLTRSFLVGDRPTDVAAAAAAGITGYQIEPGQVLAAIKHGLRTCGLRRS